MTGIYRVLVTGSRTWTDHGAVLRELAALAMEHGRLVVVHGAARDGADRFAALAAKALGAPQERHPANWRRYNRRAGYVRNEEMVAVGANECLAFLMPCEMARCAGKPPHGTHGASHCADRAERAGIKTRRFTPMTGRPGAGEPGYPQRDTGG